MLVGSLKKKMKKHTFTVVQIIREFHPCHVKKLNAVHSIFYSPD